MEITDVASAAKKLGMAEREIESVEETLHGPVVRMVDGSSYIDIEDPDAKGQTGLAYFEPPCEGYAGSFPVFASEPDPVEPVDSSGIVTEPSTAVVGEAGPEAVVPAPPAGEPATAEQEPTSPVPVKGQTAAAETPEA